MALIDIDELADSTLAEVQGVIKAWTNRPSAKWPEGTEFVENLGRYRDLATAKLPNGHWYSLLLVRKEEDPREVPPVLFDYRIDECGGVIYAYPRIANMACGVGRLSVADVSQYEAAMQLLWHGAALGLEERYLVGDIGRGLRHRTRTVSDGWE